MKKFFGNKFVWLIGIAAVAGGAMYLTTWGNKKWLINQIIDKGGTDSSTVLNSKTPAQLRSQLRSM